MGTCDLHRQVLVAAFRWQTRRGQHDELRPAILGAALLAGIYYLFSKLMLNNKARHILMEKPSVLIHKGRINEVRVVPVIIDGEWIDQSDQT